MFKPLLSSLALVGLFCFATASVQAQYADSVVSYVQGTGINPSFTNLEAVLGEPSTFIPGPFGGPIDAFNPPFLPSQILSIGAGGELTVKFSRPILNHPKNRFGIDFIIYANSGFIITNAFDPVTFEWIGTPATDGSLFAQNPGSTRVSVSRDGVNFYVLDPSLAPTVDSLLPTDGAANFHMPADPTLTQSDFAGLTVAQIRALYLGSAGGAGYDLDWAVDGNGAHISLPQVSCIKVEVLSGKSEVDGIASVFCPPGVERK